MVLDLNLPAVRLVRIENVIDVPVCDRGLAHFGCANQYDFKFVINRLFVEATVITIAIIIIVALVFLLVILHLSIFLLLLLSNKISNQFIYLF